ncbi:MAG: pilus assembly protein [Alphaproteobacteria bacterium]|nr:pilus assembly protein [Alphaproteobacteria bacterium]
MALGLWLRDVSLPSRTRHGDRAPRRLLKDRRGSTAVEFGLVALPFLVMLFAIVESTLVFFNTLTLENGMTQVARLIRTGQVQAQGMSESQFRQVLCDEIKMLMSCNENLIIDVRKFQDFGDANSPSPTDGNGNITIQPQFNPGKDGEIIMVRMYYKYHIQTPVMEKYLSNAAGGVRLLATAAVFRNEPFGEILSN